MHILSTLVSATDDYAGFEVFPNSDAHNQHQLMLCQRKSVVQHQKEKLLANDFQFFGSFFARIVIALVFACGCVAFETFVGHYFCKEKHRRRNLRRNIRVPKITVNGRQTLSITVPGYCKNMLEKNLHVDQNHSTRRTIATSVRITHIALTTTKGTVIGVHIHSFWFMHS